MKTNRTFRQIALEIKETWKNQYFGAKPYVDALLTLDTSDPSAPYIFETAKDMVIGFLANAQTFRGEVAKNLKQELKNMIGYGKK